MQVELAFTSGHHIQKMGKFQFKMFIAKVGAFCYNDGVNKMTN